MISLNLTAIIIITPTRPSPPMLAKLIMGSNFSDVYSNSMRKLTLRPRWIRTKTEIEIEIEAKSEREGNKESKKCIWSDSFT